MRRRIRKWLGILLRGRPHGVRARVFGRAGPRPSPKGPEPRAPVSTPADADPGLVDAFDAEALPPGEMVEVVVDGRALVLCNIDGSIHAVDAVCPHAGGPIGDGDLEGAMVTCPWHGWGFDVQTGRCAVDDDAHLETWPVEVRRGRILVGTGTRRVG